MNLDFPPGESCLVHLTAKKNCFLEQNNPDCVLAHNRLPGLEVIKLEYSLRLKIKHNDWLIADMCPQAANHCPLF